MKVPIRVFGCAFVVASLIVLANPLAQGSIDPRRKTFDEILDLNVRDGFVYYRALKADASRLDGYVASLGSASVEGASREEQMAFWLNAYNAVVLQTVVQRYPIPLRSRDYPPHSIRQIPGAFERLQHRLGGKTVTLDEIEQTILAPFHDPRVFLALGRGAVGGGRLRSEAYSESRLETQLAETASECVTRSQCVNVDRAANSMQISAIFSWRRNDFIAAYAELAPKSFAARSPIERAVLAFVQPRLLTVEREFLERNEFKVEYSMFDWSLNDLTGRGGR